MKKTTLIIAIYFAIQTFTFGQYPGTPPAGYTCIPDANFEQALIDFGYDTEMTLDGQILTVDASTRPSLSIINKNVLDFTGLEAFVSITLLDVSYNIGLTTLNTSSNTLLQSINTQGCSLLSTLDLSNNTVLTDINIVQCNFSDLNLAANTALEALDIRFNLFTSLDLSGFSSFTSLNGKNNSFTFLDMRNGNNANVTLFDVDFNTDLTCVFVDDASAPYLSTWIIDANSTFVNDEAECNTLDIDTFAEVFFSMYPNPVRDNLYVSAISNDTLFEIYDMTGKLVISETLVIGKNKIDVSNLSNGIYFSKALVGEKSISKKFVKN